MDFLAEFQKRVRSIDNPESTKLKINQEEVRKQDAQQVHGELYRIHKRSLPVGLDKPILWNIPLKEAIKWVRDRLKPKLISENPKIVHYYDRVRENGYLSGIYDNEYEGGLIKEDADGKRSY